MTHTPLGLARRGDDRPGAALDVERIAREHRDSLLRLARRYCACPDDAHDAVQRGLEILLRCQHRLRPDTAVAWLHVVVHHEALALTRAHARMRHHTSPLDADDLTDRDAA